MDNRYSHRRTCSPRYRRLLPCLVSSFSAVTLLQPLPSRYPGVNLFPSASLFLLLLLFFFLLILWGSFPPSPLPLSFPSPLRLPLLHLLLLLLLLYPLLHLFLSLSCSTVSFLCFARPGPKSLLQKKKSPAVSRSARAGEACAASSLPHWLSIALFISHSLSQNHRHSFFAFSPPSHLLD